MDDTISVFRVLFFRGLLSFVYFYEITFYKHVKFYINW